MLRQGSSRSWLYSWGGNIPESPENDAETIDPSLSGVKETTDATKPTANPINHTILPHVSESKLLENLETRLKQSPSSIPTSKDFLVTQTSRPNQVQKQQKSLKILKRKLSAASLTSYATSTWLGWSTKTSRSNSLPEDRMNPEFLENSRPLSTGSESTIDEEQSMTDAVVEDSGMTAGKPGTRNPHSAQLEDYKRGSVGSKDSDNVITEQKNDNDGVPDSYQRKKLWSFWNLTEDTGTNKDIPAHSRITNTILKSTPSLPSRDDVRNKPDSSKEAAADNGQGQPFKGVLLKPDDAVLYKPHHSAKEFSKINTHKNQNLIENVLVPDWNSCLDIQVSTKYLSTSLNLYSTSGIRGIHAFDLKSWKSYLSNIPARLGLTSSGADQNDDTSDESITTSGSDADKLHPLMHERSYKLYGKALSRLPPHKRACLPNPNKYYTPQQIGSQQGNKRQKTQMEADEAGTTPISITNDSAGNLLINDHPGDEIRRQSSDIYTQKVGQLKKIKKILIIGVHGFFPTRMIRPIIGAPKGTSSKFANEAEKAVIRYLVENNMMSNNESDDVTIQKIALEKEGKIFDRVDFFLKILTKWEQELNEADFVFIAAHSQGCVVSIILLGQLIRRNILKKASQKRIGILGMAGVNNGPFYGIDKSFFIKAYSAIEHESMIELFELTKFDSPQSLAYKEAMQMIIGVNVKICFVGSINDQLVPLYSALASHVFHPNIYRACYIDSSSKTPAFIKKLISFCCQLQNMGYFDNNVIKEISPMLAGPLTGNGHLKIYNDGKVYDLGIKFMLDTDDLVIPRNVDIVETTDDEETDLPLTNKVYVREYNVGKIGTNPFILPWCLRGLTFNVQKNWRRITRPIIMQNDPGIKSGAEEVNELYGLFDQWRPETKALKDLKFRLNGIRASKL